MNTTPAKTIPAGQRVDELTDAQRARLGEWRDRWLAVGLCTDPADRPRAEAAVDAAYKAAGMEPPRIKVWLRSPFEGVIGSWFLTQVWDQVRAQVRDQVGDQVGDQVRDQVWDQVGDQVRDQVWDQVRDQVRAQVRAQVWDQVRAQVCDQVWDQVRAQVRAQVRDQVRDQIWKAGYGAHDAGWLSFYDYFATVINLEAPKRLHGLIELAHTTGWWWPFQNAVILTERPTTIHRDQQTRLHNETGPALTYPDGFTIHAWHGTRVPQDLIQNGWTTERILQEPNAEIRRCAIERMGWDTFITEANLTQIGPTTQDPGNPGQTITLYDVPEQIYDEPIRVLLCTNGTIERDGTRRRFGLTVPATCETALAAAAWGYDLTPEQYATFVRRA